MIAEIQSRMFRPHPVTMGMRQHITSRTSTGLSKRMAKMVAMIICISLFVVFAFSQVMHWHIAATADKLEQLKSASVDTSAKNVELLALRAQLASQKFIEERASEKLQLFATKTKPDSSFVNIWLG